jgi:hypothetical protein
MNKPKEIMLFTLDCFTPQPKQMAVDEKFTWNPTRPKWIMSGWDSRGNYFQAYLKEVHLMELSAS